MRYATCLSRVGPVRGNVCAAKAPVFMRVRGNVPHFTISLSRRIVNGFYVVSTGFLRVFWGFVRFWAQNGRFYGGLLEVRGVWGFGSGENELGENSVFRGLQVLVKT